MKELFYRLFAFFFNTAPKKIKPNRVALISPHNASFNDSLGVLRDEFEKHGGYEILLISHEDFSSPKKALIFFTKKARQLAGAKYIFLNDNFMPLGLLDFDSSVKVVQLWHAEGAFKKFGLDIEQPEAIRRRELAANSKLSFVVCSSPSVAPIYEGAFGVKPEQVLPIGSLRADALLKCKDSAQIRAKLEEQFPQCKGKKIVLYAPTFRDDPESDARFFDWFDIKRFNEELGQTHCLFVRLHPQVHKSFDLSGAVDVTGWASANELTLAADMLITDYSSICMDFVLLGKPCFFFAPDMQQYISRRPIYFDYKNYVPGKVSENMNELVSDIQSGADTARQEEFARFNLSMVDGNSTQRLWELVMGNNT